MMNLALSPNILQAEVGGGLCQPRTDRGEVSGDKQGSWGPGCTMHLGGEGREQVL